MKKVKTGSWAILSRLDLFSERVRRIDTSLVPRLPGVYVFYFGNGKIYIGSSDNLERRIRTHEILRGFGSLQELICLKYKICHVYGYWLMLEARLLYKLKRKIIQFNRKLFKVSQ